MSTDSTAQMEHRLEEGDAANVIVEVAEEIEAGLRSGDLQAQA